MPYVFSPEQRAAVLAKWPHLAPSQLSTLAQRFASNGEDVAAVTSPADAVYYLEWCHVKKDASLIRTAPTPQQYADHKMQEAKQRGRDVTGADKMSFYREGKELDADALLAAVPVGSDVLKAVTSSAIKTEKAATYDPADQNQLVRAFADSQDQSHKALLDEHGPTRSIAMARAWHASKGKVAVDDRPGTVKQSDTNTGNKAAADAFAASPEAAAMGPADRMTEYRRILALAE